MPGFNALSDKQKQIIQLLASGTQLFVVSQRLKESPESVKLELDGAYKILGIPSGPEADRRTKAFQMYRESLGMGSGGATKVGLEGLPLKHLEVLRKVASGLDDQEIARRFSFSIGFVQEVVNEAKKRMGVEDRPALLQALKKALSPGENPEPVVLTTPTPGPGSSIADSGTGSVGNTESPPETPEAPKDSRPLSDRLKDAMEAKGLTHVGAAKEAGVSAPSIAKVLSGQEVRLNIQSLIEHWMANDAPKFDETTEELLGILLREASKTNKLPNLFQAIVSQLTTENPERVVKMVELALRSFLSMRREKRLPVLLRLRDSIKG
ncbi:MAG: hypothetical protein AAB597_03060 [Patescibacteria group bacterium]